MFMQQSPVILSVVIPLAVGDTVGFPLKKFLQSDGSYVETLVVAPQDHLQDDLKGISGLRILSGDGSRVGQLNQGAAAARGRYLWFLHADSIPLGFSLSDVIALLESEVDCPSEPLPVLWYFNLRFVDGTVLMGLNSLGARLRASLLHLPFGDQGFLLTRELYEKIGPFRSSKYGEDHMFVWKCIGSKVVIKPLSWTLGTSARKYQVNGWATTTLHHLRLTSACIVHHLWARFTARGVSHD